MTQRKTETGFTLVELAISLVVIGLLIGAVLKGQEMVENARITRGVADVHQFVAGITIFETTYGALPGDIISPSTRIPNCTTSPCNVTGNENQLYDNSYEGGNMAVHLHAAGIIKKIFYSTYPGLEHVAAVNFYKDYWLGATWQGGSWWGADYVNQLRMGNDVGVTSSRMVEALDIKLDDGKPLTGRFVAPSPCTSAGATSYANWVTGIGSACKWFMDIPGVASSRPTSL